MAASRDRWALTFKKAPSGPSRSLQRPAHGFLSEVASRRPAKPARQTELQSITKAMPPFPECFWKGMGRDSGRPPMIRFFRSGFERAESTLDG